MGSAKMNFLPMPASVNTDLIQVKFSLPYSIWKVVGILMKAKEYNNGPHAKSNAERFSVVPRGIVIKQ